MRLELTGRHVDITPALRRLVDRKAGPARAAAERQRRLGAGRPDRARSAAAAPTSRCTRAARSSCTAWASPTAWEPSLSAGARQDRQQAQKVKGKWQEREAAAPAKRRRRRAGEIRGGRRRQAGGAARRPGAAADAADPPRVAPGDASRCRSADAAREIDAHGDGVRRLPRRRDGGRSASSTAGRTAS